MILHPAQLAGPGTGSAKCLQRRSFEVVSDRSSLFAGSTNQRIFMTRRQSVPPVNQPCPSTRNSVLREMDHGLLRRSTLWAVSEHGISMSNSQSGIGPCQPVYLHHGVAFSQPSSGRGKKVLYSCQEANPLPPNDELVSGPAPQHVSSGLVGWCRPSDNETPPVDVPFSFPRRCRGRGGCATIGYAV